MVILCELLYADVRSIICVFGACFYIVVDILGLPATGCVVVEGREAESAPEGRSASRPNEINKIIQTIPRTTNV